VRGLVRQFAAAVHRLAVFALMGYEIVEGKVDARRIVETRRVNFAPAVLQVTR
jgi:hypothetical protein